MDSDFQELVRSMLKTITANIKERIESRDDPYVSIRFYISLFENRADELERYGRGLKTKEKQKMECMDCGNKIIAGVVKSNELNPRTLSVKDQKNIRCFDCSKKEKMKNVS